MYIVWIFITKSWIPPPGHVNWSFSRKKGNPIETTNGYNKIIFWTNVIVKSQPLRIGSFFFFFFELGKGLTSFVRVGLLCSLFMWQTVRDICKLFVSTKTSLLKIAIQYSNENVLYNYIKLHEIISTFFQTLTKTI